MKKKIEEVQNYFVNKITACEFDSYEIDMRSNWSIWLTVTVDGFMFSFCIPNLEKPSIIQFTIDNFIMIEIPNNRLNNLLKFIESNKEKTKVAKIEKLQSELAELTNNFEI